MRNPVSEEQGLSSCVCSKRLNAGFPTCQPGAVLNYTSSFARCLSALVQGQFSKLHTVKATDVLQRHSLVSQLPVADKTVELKKRKELYLTDSIRSFLLGHASLEPGVRQSIHGSSELQGTAMAARRQRDSRQCPNSPFKSTFPVTYFPSRRPVP